jgi:predicted alpha/beta superfamily hydrolase
MTHRVTALLVAASLAACGGSADLSSSEGAVSAQATVVVHYPTGWGHRISLRGTGPLNWSRGADATWTPTDEWRLTLTVSGKIELKPLFDDATWAIGPNWTLSPGQTLDIWPHFFRDAGQVQVIDNWWSNTLQNSRTVRVYLPPAYLENSGQRFPVVYMQDGQNLFDDSIAFGGVSWNGAGAMDQGARDGSIHEAIVVGVDATANRIGEYTPVADPQDGGGDADAYLSFLVNEIKPWVDATWRTLPGRESTAIAGSSLGGLVSAYAGVSHPDVFGLVGVFSPSTWWDNNWIIGAVQGTKGAAVQPLRVYVDSGDSGPSNDDKPQTALLAQAYQGLGTMQVKYLVQPGGQHSETYWRQRLPGALAFLLGPR